MSLGAKILEPVDDLELGRELSSLELGSVFTPGDTSNFQAKSMRAGSFELFYFYSRKKTREMTISPDHFGEFMSESYIS